MDLHCFDKNLHPIVMQLRPLLAYNKAMNQRAEDGAILAFIRHCEETGDSPTDYALCQFLGVPPQQLDAWLAGEDAPLALRLLVLFREDRLLKKLEGEPKNASAYVFLLKQPKYGGYADKAPDLGPRVVTVNMSGVGDGAFE